MPTVMETKMNSGADDRGHLGERLPVSSPIQRLESHPLREELYEEVHERPSPMLRAPMRASHMVFLTDEHSQEEAFDHVCRLARRYSANLPNAHSTCYYQDLGGFEIRWEKHTEFSSYTFLRRGITDPPFSENALAVLPVDWLEATPGLMIAAAHCVISDAPAPDPFGPELADWFEGQTLFGSRIVDDRARVFTTLRLHSDGFGRILLFNKELSDYQTGRTLQRLLELETYRIMCLLGLPEARDIGPRAARLDRQLAEIMDEFGGVSDGNEDQRLLNELTSLAAEVEHYRSATNYRFAATRAYDSLVGRRKDDLREIKFSGMSSIGKFLERRLEPAIRTCQAVEDQLESVSRRIDRATDLLGARVDVGIESQNQQLLGEMNRRGKLQLRMQQTVEGLSVAAISYYSVGLLKFGMNAMAAAGWPMNPDIGAGLSVPVVVVTVWWLIRKVRRRLTSDDAE
jgi:uncharacterized membrane-anchored protein